jgi:hypothetical protein
MHGPFIEAAVKIVAARDRSQLSCSMDTKGALMRYMSKANARMPDIYTATYGDGGVLESWKKQPGSDRTRGTQSPAGISSRRHTNTQHPC